MILITASRRPSPRIRSFIKDLSLIIPNSLRVNRGHKSLVELAIEAKRNNLRYVLVVTERRGNPGLLILYSVSDWSLSRVQLERIARIVLGGVKLSRENPESSKAYGVRYVGVDYSNCLSNECFLLADLLSKIFENILSEKPDLRYSLNEDKFIELKALNSHGRVVGPIIRIRRVLQG